jgi:hypothetical protein
LARLKRRARLLGAVANLQPFLFGQQPSDVVTVGTKRLLEFRKEGFRELGWGTRSTKFGDDIQLADDVHSGLSDVAFSHVELGFAGPHDLSPLFDRHRLQ